MIVTDLKSRTHKILEAIILEYAQTATPVGSESLCERYRFGVSPATIRNVMADLEEKELISHPHTSAGRVPTDLGYRYYVDLLMQPTRLGPEEEVRFEEFGRNRTEEPSELLHRAAEFLAGVTQTAGLVLVPQLAQGSFRHMELIPVQPTQIIGVLIASEGMVRHARLELEEPVETAELERIARFLNQELSGMPLAQVFEYLGRTLLEATNPLFPLYKRALDIFSMGPLFEEESAIILEGADFIFQAPEFQDMERTRRLLRVLEGRQQLVGLLRRDLSADGVKLHIGAENHGTGLTDCSLVAAPYRLQGGVTGAIGVLGPTRMDYPRVTALVGKMAQLVTRLFQERGR